MPGKKYITLSTRVTEKEFAELEIVANRENISVAAMLRLFVQAVINEDVELEKGELKMHVDTHNDAVSEDFYDDDFGRKVDRKFDRLRERGYPEDYICLMKEEILSGIESRIDMLPKKFDRRKVRDNDGGC